MGGSSSNKVKKVKGLVEIIGCDNQYRSGDLIFIHGLGGNALSTWHPNEEFNKNSWMSWLGEDLPELGVWSFGYEAEFTRFRGKAMPRFDLAGNLLGWLDAKKLGDRPILFITHSLGGLITKQMLNTAQTHNNNLFNKQLIKQTKGIVFLATPHTGSHLANTIDFFKIILRTNISVDELKSYNPWLLELDVWYREQVTDLGIKTRVFFETESIKGVQVVNPASANPGIQGVRPIQTAKNHISIAKPSKNDLVYESVKNFIQECFNSEPPEEQNNQLEHYIKRPPLEENVREEILKPGALIRIKGFEKFGKTLLIEKIILNHARVNSYETVSFDFNSLRTSNLKTYEEILQAICLQIFKDLKIANKLDTIWDYNATSNDSAEDCIIKVLKIINNQSLILALDNYDRIFKYTDNTNDLCALLRSWHDKSNRTGHEDFKRLGLVIAYSREVYGSFDINSSPLAGVGKDYTLEEFTNEQIGKLIDQNGLSLSQPNIDELIELVGGNPYLINIACEELRKNKYSFEKLLNNASKGSGIYTDYLRKHLKSLNSLPNLKKEFARILNSKEPIISTSDSIFYLESLGLVKVDGDAVYPRCKLYQNYFQSRINNQ